MNLDALAGVTPSVPRWGRSGMRYASDEFKYVMAVCEVSGLERVRKVYLKLVQKEGSSEAEEEDESIERGCDEFRYVMAVWGGFRVWQSHARVVRKGRGWSEEV